MKCNEIIKEYFANSTLHGVKFITDTQYHWLERIFWVFCVIISWIASGLLINASYEAFLSNAISFVVETSYKDWVTEFPSVVVCEGKNMDRVQEVAEELWGADHDFTLEEVLSEVAYFRGESYHTVHECGANEEEGTCFYTNFSLYAHLVRSPCQKTITTCTWNKKPFDCCKYFQPMYTEIGICYALNSDQAINPRPPRLKMPSDKFSGPGTLRLELLTESFVYTLGVEDVPNLVTPKTDILQVDHYISYKRLISVRNIENDPDTRTVSVAQRSCRYPDENILDVHRYYSYSACSVQCRKREQMKICNCTSHLMPNTDTRYHCNMTGMICLNQHYESLSVVVAKWTTGRKGVICDCLPSCTEVDIGIVLDYRENLYDYEKPQSVVEIGLANLPTERYKRNVVRGRLDLVVSMGGTTGLFVGASLLSFIEIVYYFTIRPYGSAYMIKREAITTD